MATSAYAEQMLAPHDRFETPEGHKAEVIGEQLVLSPTPPRQHGLIFTKLLLELDRLMPAGMQATNNVTLHMFATSERYIPDLVVMSETALDSEEWLAAADEAELVAEIVSWFNARTDRVTKVRGYAASGVPIYLLVDPLERAVTLFSEPVGESYERVVRVPFGAELALPKLVDGIINTTFTR